MVSAPSIAHYQIICPISEGGFGTTYLVEDSHIHPPAERRRIIKQLKPIHNDPQTYEIIKERFRQEAKIIEELGKGHSQIPVLYGYFEEQGNFYLVEEYIEGKTLDQVVAQQGKLNESQVKTNLGHLLCVLEYLQNRKIIHRDIKPENIILREFDGLPVLIDFGTMKESMGTMMTPSGHSTRSIVIGTPGFMPPEQMAGRSVYASDIYALGLTAIYLLTGKRPEELDSDPMTGDLLWQSHAPQVSPALVSILNQAIHSQAKERFLTAKQMAFALENPIVLLQASSVHQMPKSTVISPPPTQLSDPPTPLIIESSQVIENINPQKRHFPLISIIVTLIGTVIGVTLVGLYLVNQSKILVTFQPSPSPTIDRNTQQQQLEENNQQLQKIKQLQEEKARLEREIANPSKTSPHSPIISDRNWQSSCGSLAGSGSIWYGVAGDADAVSIVKNRFCGDALIVKGNTQAASFTSYEEAEDFANFLSNQTGYHFWVKEPKEISSGNSSSYTFNDLSYRSSCGDPFTNGKTWYSVVGYSDSLSTVKNRYCGDALINKSGNVQVASFTSHSRAENFANQLESSTGMDFWVKTPD